METLNFALEHPEGRLRPGLRHLHPRAGPLPPGQVERREGREVLDRLRPDAAGVPPRRDRVRPGGRARWAGSSRCSARGPTRRRASRPTRGPITNKSVGARMAIISAGVIMNLILGLACFVYAYGQGMDEIPAKIGAVDRRLAGLRGRAPARRRDRRDRRPGRHQFHQHDAQGASSAARARCSTSTSSDPARTG